MSGDGVLAGIRYISEGTTAGGSRVGPSRSLSPYPSPVCTHHVDARPRRRTTYGVAAWGKRRFMTKCAASASTLMSRPLGPTCNRLVTTATPPASRHAGSGDGVWATGCRRWPCPEPPTSGVDIPCGSASSRRAIGGHSVGTASGPAPRSPYAASAQTRRQQPPEVRSRLQPSSPGRGGKGSQCSHRRRRRSATGKAHRTSSRGASRNPVFVVQCRSRRR